MVVEADSVDGWTELGSASRTLQAVLAEKSRGSKEIG